MVKPFELVMIRQAASATPAVNHPLHASRPSSGCFAHMVLQVPSDSAPGSVHVAFDGQPLQTATLKDRFGATVTAAYSDCDCSLTCAPSSCALFLVYELCLTDVRFCVDCCCEALQVAQKIWSTSRFD